MGEDDFLSEMVAVDEDFGLGVGFSYHNDNSVFEPHGQFNLCELFLNELAVALDDYIVVGLHI